MSRENAGDIHISDIKQDICGVNVPASMASQSTKKGDAQANPKHWVESTRAVSGIPGSPDGRNPSLPGYVLLSEEPSLKKKSSFHPFKGGRCACSCDVEERKATRNVIILAHSFLKGYYSYLMQSGLHHHYERGPTSLVSKL